MLFFDCCFLFGIVLFFVQKVPEVELVQNVEFYSETNLLN